MKLNAIFVSVLLVKFGASGKKWEYRFKNVSEVNEVQDQSESVNIPTEVQVCRQSPEEGLRICREALEQPFAKKHDIQAVYRFTLKEEKLYEFVVIGANNKTKPPVIVSACSCSTSPPIYLRNNSSGKYIDVYVAHRDTYVEHFVKSENISFKFEMVVYSKSFSFPVTPYNSKLRICRMKREEKLDMCKKMLAEPFARNYGIEYLDGYGFPLFEERMYEIKLAEFEYTFDPPLFLPACMCPTMPPTFLRAKLVKMYMFVYVVLRDELLLSEPIALS